MTYTQAEIDDLIIANVLSGGRRTLAENVRTLLTKSNASYVNKKDGGLVVEALLGYSSALAPTDDYHFATKKYVDDNGGGGSYDDTPVFYKDGSRALTGPITGSDIYLLVDGVYTKAWQELTQTYAAIGFASDQLLIDASGIALSVTGASHNISLTSNNGNISLSAIVDISIGAVDNITIDSDIVTIGASSASIVNIGNAGATVNILGLVVNEYATNAYVTDKLITLNKDGGAATGIGVGFEIEENAVITGYFKTNSTRNGYDFLTPAIAYKATLSLASLTADTIYTLPNKAITFAGIANETFTGLTTVNTIQTAAGSAVTKAIAIGGTGTGLWRDVTYDGIKFIVNSVNTLWISDSNGVIAKNAFTAESTLLASNTVTIDTGTANALPVNIVRGTASASIIEFSKTGFTDNGSLFQYSDANGVIAGLSANAIVSDAGVVSRVNAARGAWFFQMDNRPLFNRFNVINITSGGVTTTHLNIDSAGLATFSGLITANSDNDGTFVLGRGKLGSFIGSDTFSVAHFDNANATDYALAITQIGDVYCNAKSARFLYGMIGNSVITTLSSTGLGITTGNIAFAAASPSITNASGIFSITNNASGQALRIETLGAGSANTGVTIALTSNATNSNTARALMTIGATYSPTSGTTANFRGINVASTINETSTAANTIALIDLNPTLTSVRGVLYGLKIGYNTAPTGGGTAWGIYADGTTMHYMLGNTGIGTTAVTTSILSLGASTTAKSSLNIPSGTAPSSPVNGDIWSDGNDLKVRLGGVTYTLTKV